MRPFAVFPLVAALLLAAVEARLSTSAAPTIAALTDALLHLEVKQQSLQSEFALVTEQGLSLQAVLVSSCEEQTQDMHNRLLQQEHGHARVLQSATKIRKNLRKSITPNIKLAKCFAKGSNARDLYIVGCNLQIVNGALSNTQEELKKTDTQNGKGNLIIGYNEATLCPTCLRSGSHTLVMGTNNDYTGHGGIVTGSKNKAEGPYSSVVGGEENTAFGLWSTAIGGKSNTVESMGEGAAITGGEGNSINVKGGSIAGGEGNECTGLYSAVLGGENNVANGDWSTVVGGLNVAGPSANFAVSPDCPAARKQLV